MTDTSKPEPDLPTPPPSLTDYFNLATESATTALANLRPHHFHDRVLLLPIVEQTNFLYTKHGITPNQITIFNGIVVSSAFLYSMHSENLFAMLFFMFVRNVLDGSDGYIARKNDLTSPHGDILDHVFDTATMNAGFVFILTRYMPLVWALIWGQLQIMGCTVIQFDPRFKQIRWLCGAENYDFPMLLLSMLSTIILYIHI
jgi:hypothetical protein